MNQPSKASNGALALAALGVVYGDIGTSPLYAFKEAFTGTHGLTPPNPMCWRRCPHCSGR